ncbi:programmed cell death protein 7-like [Saccostrea echinata]|uniref:programmed cell death protein 7-like n=1 Tax=Saccostrea echinata TaxID=191078 RepID=UPI002A817A5C|nr:programmed cell death protein 7-like [Saccostrea echinata]
MERNQQPNNNFETNFIPRFQFERPRNMFEGPRWQGNSFVQNDFQRPPPSIGQGFYHPPALSNSIHGPGPMDFPNNTRVQGNTPDIPIILGDVAGNLSNQNSSNVNFQHINPHNIQHFQRPPMQATQPISVQQQNMPLPNPMQFTAPPPLPIQSVPRPTFTPDTAPKFEPQKVIDDATVAKQWLDVWLKKREKGKVDPELHASSFKSVSINSTQDKLRRMMLLMAQLQQETTTLSDQGTSAPDDVWDNRKQKVLLLKTELKKIQEELSDETTINQVKQKVLQQRKKRERLKRRRQEQWEEKQREEEKRNNLHAEIDGWQEKLRKKANEEREAKELKKSADAILNEVRKKISDVTKTLDLLKGIQKLRKLRSDRLKQQGVHANPASDEKFKEVMDEQFNTMKKQKEIYLAEEKALQVMLETEHEETKEKEREQQEKVQRLQKERESKKLQEIMFGKSENFSEGEAMLPFYQFYDQANYSYESFIQIRQDWDRFIVPENAPGGSRVPTHLVTPTEPSSEKWASVMKDT